MSRTAQSGLAVPGLPDGPTAAVTERAHELLWAGSATGLSYAAGTAMLYLQPQTWSVRFSLGVTAFLALLLATGVWRYGTERGRRGVAVRLLAEYAVLRSADPGDGPRAAADDAARGFVRRRFLSWASTLVMVGLPLFAGQWDQPAWAVPGAVLVGVAGAFGLIASEREARAGRRWLAAPPGPPRH